MPTAELSEQLPLEVVIVTYGQADMVSRCLTSLWRHAPTAGRMMVHVVDNDSPDNTADVVASRFPAAKLHRQSWNSGFAVANNVALRQVAAPYTLVLNPDTELRAGVLDRLIEELEQDQEIGVIGCRLETADGVFDHASKRSIPSVTDAVRYFAPRLAPHRASSYLAPDVPERGMGEVEAINGAFMLIRTAAMAEVGYLDESYWMYGEDLDWCVRFRVAGWKVVYDGRETVVHLKGGTSGRSRPVRLNWHFHRSMAIFYRAHLAGRNRFVDVVAYAGIIGRFAVTTAAWSARRLAAQAPRRTGAKV